MTTDRFQHVNPECILVPALIDLPVYNILFCHSTQMDQRLMAYGNDEIEVVRLAQFLGIDLSINTLIN